MASAYFLASSRPACSVSHNADPFAAILKQDTRYALFGYLFLFSALDHTRSKLGVDKLPAEQGRHVSGPQLLDGIKELALREFGFLARTVLEAWGVRRTEDWGNMVFNLVRAGIMGKTDNDRLEDFANGYDFEEVFERAYFRDGLYRVQHHETDAEPQTADKSGEVESF